MGERADHGELMLLRKVYGPGNQRSAASRCPRPAPTHLRLAHRVRRSWPALAAHFRCRAIIWRTDCRVERSSGAT